MKSNKTYSAAIGEQSLALSKFKDYALLVKLRLSLVVVFSSVLGYLITAGSDVSYVTMWILAAGGLLVTAAANALNQVLEREFDCLMTRTLDRPVTAGRMKSSEAVMFAGLACLFGVGLLSSINMTTAFLGMLSMVMYAFLYTPLKRYSTLAVAIGAIPGALPVLIGSTAAHGELTYLGLALFAIQFLWQFPHFWAIGFNSFEDYKKAGFKLLPEKSGQIDRSLGMHATLYALLILPVIAYLYSTQLIAWIPAILLLGLSLGYVLYSYRLHVRFDKASALKLMFYSFLFLPLFLLIILVGNIS